MYLMSKNTILAQIDFTKMIFYIYEPNLMPIALRGDGVNLFTLRDWLNNRVLNISRSNAKKIISALRLNQNNRIEMCFACKALSLTDCYWLKTENSKDTWEKVNLYNNSLSSAVAKIALTGEYVSISGKARTPELTNGGSYAKCWKRHKDGIYLYKTGSLQGNGKEHLIEVLCSDLLDSLDVPHVKYFRTTTDGKDTSCCKNITDENISICKMDYVLGYAERNNKNNEIRKWLHNQPDYWKMLIVDYLIHNSDRHTGNWGVFFDANTGEILRLHPLFDHNIALELNTDTMSKVIQGKTLEEVAKYAKKHIKFDVSRLEKLLNTRKIKYQFYEIFNSDKEYKAIVDRVKTYKSW